jgi:hypothetical protein
MNQPLHFLASTLLNTNYKGEIIPATGEGPKEATMGPNILEANYGSESVGATETGCRRQRALTYDESKAAEAAFRGEPFNPSWSAAARSVYEGISVAMIKKSLAATTCGMTTL